MGLPLRGRGIAEALEGDRHLGDVAVLDDPRRALEERVPRPVRGRDRLGDRPGTGPEAAPADRHDAVSLHPVAIDVEVVAALLVEKGVEVDRHEVIHRGAVALHAVRPHDAHVLVVDVESEIDVVGVVGDVDVRRFRARRTLDRGLLGELHQVRGPLPHLVVEHAVEDRGNGDAGRSDPRSAGDEAELLRGRKPAVGRGAHTTPRGPGGLGRLLLSVCLRAASEEEREERRRRQRPAGLGGPS